MSAQGRNRWRHDHAFVNQFIILPNFGQAVVHVRCHKAGKGSVRYGSRIPQPPSPPRLVPADSLVPCKVQSPTLLGRRKPALFYVRVFVMPALVAGIHVVNSNSGSKDVDGRDNPAPAHPPFPKPPTTPSPLTPTPP